MFNELTGLALGIITFAVLIGIGSVILFNFGNSTGGAANTNTQYMLTQIGQSGLAGWTPAIIALSIGLLFLGAFLFGKGRGRR